MGDRADRAVLVLRLVYVDPDRDDVDDAGGAGAAPLRHNGMDMRNSVMMPLMPFETNLSSRAELSGLSGVRVAMSRVWK